MQLKKRQRLRRPQPSKKPRGSQLKRRQRKRLRRLRPSKRPKGLQPSEKPRRLQLKKRQKKLKGLRGTVVSPLTTSLCQDATIGEKMRATKKMIRIITLCP